MSEETKAQETEQERADRIGRKCAEHASSTIREILSLLDAKRTEIAKDPELANGIVYQIMAEAIVGAGTPIIMASSDYAHRVAKIQTGKELSETPFILAAQAEFLNSVLENLGGAVQQRAFSSKSSLVGV